MGVRRSAVQSVGEPRDDGVVLGELGDPFVGDRRSIDEVGEVLRGLRGVRGAVDSAAPALARTREPRSVRCVPEAPSTGS